MTPTQAQIMREALEEIANHRIDSEFASLEKRNMAARALAAAADKQIDYSPSTPIGGTKTTETAAAEVGRPMFECPKCGADLALVDTPHKCAAAAEVGERRQEGMAWIAHETKLRTIERCARVADSYVWGINSSVPAIERAPKIAAAIRALKDQPTDPNLQYPGKDPDFVFPEE